jgi:hypothetical protein
MKTNILLKRLTVILTVIVFLAGCIAAGGGAFRKNASASAGEGNEVAYAEEKLLDNEHFNTTSINDAKWRIAGDVKAQAAAEIPEADRKIFFSKTAPNGAYAVSKTRVQGAMTVTVDLKLGGFNNKFGFGLVTSDTNTSPYTDEEVMLFSHSNVYTPWGKNATYKNEANAQSYADGGYDEAYYNIPLYHRAEIRIEIDENGDAEVYISSTDAAYPASGVTAQDQLQDKKVATFNGIYADIVTNGGYFAFITNASANNDGTTLYGVKIESVGGGELFKEDFTTPFPKATGGRYLLNAAFVGAVTGDTPSITLPDFAAAPTVVNDGVSYTADTSDADGTGMLMPDAVFYSGYEVEFGLNPHGEGGADRTVFCFTSGVGTPTFTDAKTVMFIDTGFWVGYQNKTADYTGWKSWNNVLRGRSKVKFIAQANGDLDIYSLYNHADVNAGGGETIEQGVYKKAYTAPGFLSDFYGDDGTGGFRVMFKAGKPDTVLIGASARDARKNLVYDSMLSTNNIGSNGTKSWIAGFGVADYVNAGKLVLPTNFGAEFAATATPGENGLYCKTLLERDEFKLTYSYGIGGGAGNGFGVAFGLDDFSDTSPSLMIYMTADKLTALIDGADAPVETELDGAYTANTVITVKGEGGSVSVYIDNAPTAAATYANVVTNGYFGFAGFGSSATCLYTVDMLLPPSIIYAPVVTATAHKIIYVGAEYDFTPDITDPYGETVTEYAVTDAAGRTVGAAAKFTPQKAGLYTVSCKVTNSQERYTTKSVTVRAIMPDKQTSVTENFNGENFDARLTASDGVSISDGALAFGGGDGYFGTAGAASNFIFMFDIVSAEQNSVIGVSFGRALGSDAIADGYYIRFEGSNIVVKSGDGTESTHALGVNIYEALSSGRVTVKLDVRGGAVKLSVRPQSAPAESLNIPAFTDTGFWMSGLVGVFKGQGGGFKIDNFNFVNTNASFPGNTETDENDPRQDDSDDPAETGGGDDGNKGLNAGQIAGIVAGSVAGAGGIGVGAYFLITFLKKRKAVK